MALLDHVREALLEIRFALELWEMDRKGLGKGAHPIDRHGLDRAPGTERARVEPPRNLYEIRRFSIEVATQLPRIAELFVLQHADCADVTKGSRQLVMVSIAARQSVIVDENSQLALAQCRTIEMRRVIHRRTGRMHSRLVDQK